MTHTMAIHRFCTLVTMVGERRFQSAKAHDCFCGDNPAVLRSGPVVDDDIVRYIEHAVEEHLRREFETDDLTMSDAAQIAMYKKCYDEAVAQCRTLQAKLQDERRANFLLRQGQYNS